METPKDRILKAINHIQPDTTPVHIIGFEGIERWLERFSAKDDFDLRDKLNLDLQSARPIYDGPHAKSGLSIWGTSADVAGYRGSGYSKVRNSYPLANAISLQEIERFAWPDPDDFDYEIVGKLLEKVLSKARLVTTQYTVSKEGFSREDVVRGVGTTLSARATNWLPIFCTLFELFGLEETLMKFYTEPKIIEAAIYHLETFMLEFSRRIIKATEGLADIFWFGDDFATARGLMISPEQWRRFLKPTYRKIFEIAKSYKLKIWFHCCGQFRPVMSDLIDIGMDVWETCQIHLPGNEAEVLKREYGQYITFYGAVNTQQTLPFGTSDDVRAEVRERIKVLGKGGGYICGPDHTILPDVPVENVLAMIDEAKGFSFLKH